MNTLSRQLKAINCETCICTRDSSFFSINIILKHFHLVKLEYIRQDTWLDYIT